MKLADALDFPQGRRPARSAPKLLPWLALAVAALWLAEMSASRPQAAKSSTEKQPPRTLQVDTHHGAAALRPRREDLPRLPAFLRPQAPVSAGGDVPTATAADEAHAIQLCQALGPAAPCDIQGVDCFCNGTCGQCETRRWHAMGPINWQAYAQGEYVGHWRLPHVPVYQLRVDDQLECIYRLTRDVQPTPYKLNVGDEVQIESFTDPNLNRNLIIQPDGTVTLRLLGEMRAAGLSVQELRGRLEDSYSKYYKMPSMTVTPLKVNTQLDDLRAAVDNRAGSGGQGRPAKVTPQGTIDLPGLNNIPAQGLTLDELKQEISFRYEHELGIGGIEVTPILTQRAPRFIYVLGEVNTPGRFTMEGPTTLIQALSMAGSWRVGANLRHVVVFRRGDDWRLMATRVNVQGALVMGNQPCPPGEIWLDDSDIVIVPKTPILIADDLINLYITRGVYAILPFSTFYSFNGTAIVE